MHDALAQIEDAANEICLDFQKSITVVRACVWLRPEEEDVCAITAVYCFSSPSKCLRFIQLCSWAPFFKCSNDAILLRSLLLIPVAFSFLQDKRTVIYQSPGWRPSIRIRLAKARIPTQIRMDGSMSPAVCAIRIVYIKTR